MSRTVCGQFADAREVRFPKNNPFAHQRQPGFEVRGNEKLADDVLCDATPLQATIDCIKVCRQEPPEGVRAAALRLCVGIL